MKRLLLLLMFICSVSLVFSQTTTTTTVQTIEDNRRIGFGLQLGYFSPADADNPGVFGGIVAQAKFTQSIGAEISFNYRREKYSNGLVTVKSWPLLFSVLYFPIDQFYGMAGLGVYNTTFDYPNFNIGGAAISDETKTEVGGHIGAGTSFKVSPVFRMFSNISYHFIGYDLKAVEQVQGETEVNAGYLSIMLGLLFEF